MRFITFIVAVFSATAVSAATIPAEKREADALCLWHGQGCWKRDAAPVPSLAAREAEAEADADPLCLWHGQGCWKRAADPEAEAEALCLWHGQGCWKDKRDAAPEPVADPLCLWHGQGCWKRDAEKREADALCLWHGQGCWKDKREAAPEAEAEAEPLCLWHGQGCWKRQAEEKRTPDPLCLWHGQGCWKREAAAIAAPEADPLCLWHGQGCWKRDANAVADPLCLWHGQGCWKEKREAAPLPAPAADPEADPLCLFNGQGCSEAKREAAPEAAPEPSPEALCLWHGQGCWKVKRAVYAFANAVRSFGAAPETREAAISNSVGGAAYNVKRATNEIAQLLAGRTTDPIKFLDNLYLTYLFGPDAAINTTLGAAADDFSLRRRSTEVDRRLCLVHGQGCWTRDAPVGSPAGSAADKRACNAPGAACDIARRAAEALVSEIESFRAPEKRADVLEERLCLWHGQGCWKRDTVEDLVTRCHAPGGACDNASRDLKVMHTAARALLDYVNEA